MIRYTVHSCVLDVRERFHEFWESGVGPQAAFRKESRGYFALFEGSHEAIHLGMEPPELKVGDRVKIMIEKEQSYD